MKRLVDAKKRLPYLHPYLFDMTQKPVGMDGEVPGSPAYVCTYMHVCANHNELTCDARGWQGPLRVPCLRWQASCEQSKWYRMHFEVCVLCVCEWDEMG